MLIRCHVCHRDPAGRWVQPPALIFCEDITGETIRACREHVSKAKEAELQARERALGFKLK